MKRQYVRLALAAAAFAGWIGYLGYLVAERPRTPEGQPLVLSRAQLMASDVDVIAHVNSPDEPVRLVEVLRAGPQALAVGQELRVEHLGRAQARAAGPEAPDPPKDFTGPGEYLIPLTYHADTQSYSVAQVPPSPGFMPPPPSEKDIRENSPVREAWFEPATRWPVYRIYPATEEARAQYRQARPGS